MNPWRPSGSAPFSGASAGCRSRVPGCAQLPISRRSRAHRPSPTVKKCRGAAHRHVLVVKKCGGAADQPISVVESCRGAADQDILTVKKCREAADHHFSAVKISRGAAPRHVSIVKKGRSAGTPTPWNHRKCWFYSDLGDFHRFSAQRRVRWAIRGRRTNRLYPPGGPLTPALSRGARAKRPPAIPSPGLEMPGRRRSPFFRSLSTVNPQLTEKWPVISSPKHSTF
jgi:hypothetical protein